MAKALVADVFQTRKYNIGMILAHQFLGQLDTKLHEAISANTIIKFAGGVFAKNARVLAIDLRSDPAFIESQQKLSFAAIPRAKPNRPFRFPLSQVR